MSLKTRFSNHYLWDIVMNKPALQDIVVPEGICFGCGPKNPEGLQIKSYWDEDNVHVIATHMPDEKYNGWPGLVYGGLIACLIDCHSNAAAIAYHYRNENRDEKTSPLINCVTGTLNIKYIKPTPMGVLLTLKARLEGKIERKTRIICDLYAGDTLTAIGDSIFVRVDVSDLAKSAHCRS